MRFLEHTSTAATTVWLLAWLLAPLSSQSGRILGLVRSGNGRPLVDARVLAIPVLRTRLPWLQSDLSPAELVGRTDARGRFSFSSDSRTAVWVEGRDETTIVPTAAPGVPVVATARPHCVLELGAGAIGAWLRVDGIALGYRSGTELGAPGGRVELLVETTAGAFVAACRAEAGQRIAVVRPETDGGQLRGVPPGASVVVVPWLGRPLATDQRGFVSLPATNGPLRVRVATSTAEGEAFDEIWSEPGKVVHWDPGVVEWEAVVVRGGDGNPLGDARIATLHGGPGRPALASLCRTDSDGIGYYRAGVEPGHVVVVADGHALAIGQPVAGGVMRLKPGLWVRLRIVDENSLPIPGARVTTTIDPFLDQEVFSDDRGGVALRQLPGAPIAIRITHPEHLPLTTQVDPSAAGAVELTLGTGRELRGTVSCVDASRLGSVVVEIRDASGVTGMRPRTTRTDIDGGFSFSGLPDHGLTIVARCTDGERTWSGMLRSIRPGDQQPIAIVIERDEPLRTFVVPDIR